MYYLTDRPERAFVSEELMLIPEDQNCLLITFRHGNICPTGIYINCELFHSFSLSELLFFQCHSFLRNSYLIERYWRIGTEPEMHGVPRDPEGPFQSFIFISLSEACLKVLPQRHFPTPVLNS